MPLVLQIWRLVSSLPPEAVQGALALLQALRGTPDPAKAAAKALEVIALQKATDEALNRMGRL